MQQQLQDLQPELIQTSEETKLLMVKIEKDTIEAEAKKEVLICACYLYNKPLLREHSDTIYLTFL